MSSLAPLQLHVFNSWMFQIKDKNGSGAYLNLKEKEKKRT